MYLDNHDYKNHDDLIIVTKNNHDISTFNDNCSTLDQPARSISSHVDLYNIYSFWVVNKLSYWTDLA